MEWLSRNWIWLALAVGFVAFFARGRGGCGMGHGGHEHQQGGRGDRSPETSPSASVDGLGPEHAGHAGTAGAGQKHRHGCC